MIESFSPIQGLISRWNDFKAFQKKKSEVPYRCHYPLEIKTFRYSVTVAETWEQVIAALTLRHRVFTQEFQAPKTPFQLDLDNLDLDCDHLTVIDNLTQQVVGTYRLLSSDTCWNFYHQNEFINSAVLLKRQRFLELGRACIDTDHRNGLVLRLLWRAILQYARRCQAQVLIGCSSVNVQKWEDIREISHYFLSRGELILETPIKPTPEYKVPNLNLDQLVGAPCNPRDEILEKISPLLRSYLSAGAKIHGEPAFDREFQCIDYFTLLNLSSLSPRYG